MNITDQQNPALGCSVTQLHNADAQVIPANANSLLMGGMVQLFNGATFDRQRCNVNTDALVTHTAASAGVAGADQLNINSRGVQIGVNITAGTGTTPTLQVIIEGKDAASGAYYTLLASAAIAATAGFTLLTVYPGLTAAANSIANQVLPRVWRVRTVIGGTTPAVTATVGASVIQ